MENVERFVKAHTKAFLGLGFAAALGAAAGVNKVAQQRAEELSRPETQKKVKNLFRLSYRAAYKTAREVGKDLNTVAESVKERTADKLYGCPNRCDCGVKGFVKSCCKKAPVADVVEEVAPETSRETETEGLPEPVRAADVVAQHEASDLEAEEEKNKKLATPVEADAAPVVKKPAAPRKPRTPRAPKAPETPSAE